MYFFDTTFSSEERYDVGRFMEYANNGYDILTSFFVSRIKDLPIYGTYRIRGEERKPMLLSHQIYGDIQYWWILMMYNGLLDICALTAGLLLKYPSIDSIEDLFYQLRTQEVAQTSSNW
jgi:hypothetical protein